MLCLATAAIWVRSYWVGDRAYGRAFGRPSEYHCWTTVVEIRSERGGCSWDYLDIDLNGPNVFDPDGSRWPWLFEHYHPERSAAATMQHDTSGATSLRASLGFFWYRHDLKDPMEDRDTMGLAVPYWAIFALTTAGGIFAIRRLWPKRSIDDRNRCMICGYDLRATPGRCPECGAVNSTTTEIRRGENGREHLFDLNPPAADHN